MLKLFNFKMRTFLVLIFVIIILSYCKTTVNLQEELNKKIQETMTDSQEIPVYILTNRKTNNTTKECSNDYFKNQPGSTQWLICYVNVPKYHSVGALNSQKKSILDKDVHFYARNLIEIDEKDFFAKLKKEKEILIFVHGFNVEFEEAIYRSAQIKYDLKFQGAVVVFSWPAGPEEGFLSNFRINETYKTNQKFAVSSINVFKDFLANVIEIKTKETKIYLIVHSMGHQIVLPVLAELSKTLEKNNLDEVILNAPDYPIIEWKRIKDLVKKTSKRITIYCSPKDNALLASETINGNKRLGQCLKSDGIDVINVNRVDSPILGIGGLGHGYYSGRAILTDLFQLILGIEAKKRLFIITSNQNTEDYLLRD